MAAKKYIAWAAGKLQRTSAVVMSGGAGNDGDLVALDSTGKLDNSVLPVGIGADTASIVASEALSAGDFVNIWNDAGTIKVRKADATTSGKEADGFVLSSVSSAADATVYFEGQNNQLTGLTLGARYYLSTTPGATVDASPSANGNVSQYLGKAVSATSISTEFEDGVIL